MVLRDLAELTALVFKAQPVSEVLRGLWEDLRVPLDFREARDQLVPPAGKEFPAYKVRRDQLVHQADPPVKQVSQEI